MAEPCRDDKAMMSYNSSKSSRAGSPSEICPACGASGRTPWGTCQACGHYYLAAGWTQVPRRRHPSRWLALGLGVVAVLCAWIASPFLPDPLTSVFHRPTTQLSSTSLANHWAMWGGDLQQWRYVAEAPRQPEGRRAWSVALGSPTRSVPVVVDNVLYIGGHFTLLALDAGTGQRRWEIRTTAPVHTSLAVAGNRLYFGLQDWRVLALDRGTGQTLWEFQMQNPVAGSAAVAQGMVYIGSLDGCLRSEEHTSELQSLAYLVCRLLLEKKKKNIANERRQQPPTPRDQ